MKLLKLTGKYAINEYSHSIVDDEDYNILMQLNRSWLAKPCMKNKQFKLDKNYKLIIYPTTSIKQNKVCLSRFIMKIYDPIIKVDHINHNTLDNRKENLRIATNRQNCFNSTSRKNSTSQFLGVSYCKWKLDAKKWRSRIRIEGKSVCLGCYYTEIEAALAYDKVARDTRNEFANLNFPDGVEL